MTEVSERSRFYLENRELIESWADLKRDVALDAHRFYGDLATRIEERREEVAGKGAIAELDIDEGSLHVYRSGWVAREADEPIASVYLSWKPAKVDFIQHAYIGVWVDDSDAETMASLLSVLDASEIGFRRAKNDLYIERLPVDDDGWKDLDELAKTIEKSFIDLWATSFLIIDRVATERSEPA